MPTEEEIVECDCCEENFDIEQEGIDIDDEYYCDGCVGEYTYVCSLCEGLELLDKQGRLGSVLLVDDKDDEINLPNGIYQIIDRSYYTCDLFGDGEIFDDSVRRIGDLPADKFSLFGYPCGHVCRWCDPEVIGMAVANTCWPWLVDRVGLSGYV